MRNDSLSVITSITYFFYTISIIIFLKQNRQLQNTNERSDSPYWALVAFSSMLSAFNHFHDIFSGEDYLHQEMTVISDVITGLNTFCAFFAKNKPFFQPIKVGLLTVNLITTIAKFCLP